MNDDDKAAKCVQIAKAHLRRDGYEPEVLEVEKLALHYMDLFTDNKVNVEFASLSKIRSTRSAKLARYATTHEGRLAIADAIHTERLAEGEVVEALRLAPKHLDLIYSLIRNPCAECDSVRLEESWAGTGYCSLACCDKVRRTGNEAARRYAAITYDNWLIEEREK